MFLSWLGPLVRRLFRIYIERLVCLHFCKFKEAGSDFGFTHVHVLGKNDRNATGLGHDDHTNNSDAGHVTVSGPAGVGISAEDDSTLALRRAPYLTTAHFHEATPGHACADGFRRIRCRCGSGSEARESTVCYTTDAELFENWRLANYWPQKVGTYDRRSMTPNGVTATKPGRIACGNDFSIRAITGGRVPSCDGFGGPQDGENQFVRTARAEAQAAAALVLCDGTCARTVTEIFCGWKCGHTAPDLPPYAEAIVILRVSCARN